MSKSISSRSTTKPKIATELKDYKRDVSQDRLARYQAAREILKTNDKLGTKTILKPKDISQKSSRLTSKQSPIDNHRSNFDKKKLTKPEIKSVSSRRTSSTISTPTSSRVTTSKYIPPKQGSLPKPTENPRRERTKKREETPKPQVRSKSRTLSPSEVKILNNVEIVKKNPEVQIDPQKSPSEEFEYEDDFDSYESDFENYSPSSSSTSNTTPGALSETSSSEEDTSSKVPFIGIQIVTTVKQRTEEEKKLDSGNYELPDPKSVPLVVIKENIEKQQDVSFSDEGYDEKSLSSMPKFINFEIAQQTAIKSKAVEATRKRGRDILSMIQLDTLSAALLEMLPIPYEIFMQNYGRKDAQQVFTQTNDDALSEEIQTEFVEMEEKWTQFPSEYSGRTFEKLEDILDCHQHLKGVGSPNDSRTSIKNCNEYSVEKLKLFVSSSSQVIFKLLSSNSSKTETLKTTLPFSLGYKKLNTDLDFLRNRKVRVVDYSVGANTTILTAHDRPAISNEDYGNRTLICIWSVNHLTLPQKVLMTTDVLNTACFGCKTSLVFGGLRSGGVSVWDLRENVVNHPDFGFNCNFRSPTFISIPEGLEDGQRNETIAIRYINAEENFNSVGSGQICTLSKIGKLTIWSIVTTSKLISSQVPTDEGIAFWGTIRLVLGTVLDLWKFSPSIECEFECFDLQIDCKDNNHLYITTNSPYVIHCTTSGCKVMPKYYGAGDMSGVRCLEVCPFMEPFFLVGCNDGSMRLHGKYLSKSVMILYSPDNLVALNPGLKFIQWSKTKPHDIFTVDYNNTLHVWNLESSDIYPMFSIPFKKEIVQFKVLPVQNLLGEHVMLVELRNFFFRKNNFKLKISVLSCIFILKGSVMVCLHAGRGLPNLQNLFNEFDDREFALVLAFENGAIEIHRMNSDFVNSTKSDIENDLKKLLLYVDLL